MINYLKELEKRDIECDTETERDNIIILCPFHNDTTPSCHVSTVHGGFHCWGCHAKGSYYKLIGKIDGISAQLARQRLYNQTSDETIKYLTQSLKDLKKETTSSSSAVKISQCAFDKVFKPLPSEGIHYLQGRGISLKSIDSFHIRYGTLGRFKNRVIIPIRNPKGEIVSYTGRTINPNVTPKTRKSKDHSPHSTLFGIHELMQSTGKRKFEYFILVEAEISSIYLQQYGIYALSTMGSHGLSSDQINLLVEYCTGLVYLNYDKDDAGRSATQRDLTGYLIIDKKKIKYPLAVCNFLPVEALSIPKARKHWTKEIREAKDPNELSPSIVKKFYRPFLNNNGGRLCST